MNYLKQIHKNYNFFSITFQSIVISLFIYILDHYDISNYILGNKNILFFANILVFLVISFIVLEVINKKLWNMIAIPSVLFFDKILFLLIFPEIISLFIFFKTRLFFIFSIILCLITVIFIFIRLKIYMNKQLVISKKISNAYSIFDLYNNNISNPENGFILLNEQPIVKHDDDLLNLDVFINVIEDILKACRPQETFVFSLNGDWGSGKTSVINLLQEKLNNDEDCIIASFSPWKYDNKLSLFKGFYNFIFGLICSNYLYQNYSNLMLKYEKVIFNIVENKIGISLFDFIENNDETEIENIRNQINDVISTSDKRIIIVIDDIDRLNKDDILFIFKIVKNIFNFNMLTYILCFDENRVNKIFSDELKIDPNYLNKVIQNKIYVPIKSSDELTSIGSRCLTNLLEINNINIVNHAKYEEVTRLVFEQCGDLREIIRFLNSISVTIRFLNFFKLDLSDYILLEFIKFKNVSLYNYIYNNSKFFISEENSFHNPYEFYWPEKYNMEAKNFFDELFKIYGNFKDILAKIFPNVKKYNDNQSIKEKNDYFNLERRESIVNKNCYNGRYFKSFFTITHTFFTSLNNLVDSFIENVNNNKNLESEFKKIISEVDYNNHDLLFEVLNIRILEILDRKSLFYYVLDNIDTFENKGRFLQLNSCDRAKVLLHSIIKEESDYDIQKEYIDVLYKKDMSLLEKVIDWLESDKYNTPKQIEKICQYGKSKLVKKLSDYMNNKKNIFMLDDYKHLLWLLYRNIEDKEKLKEYILALLNVNNIFKFLGCFVTTYIGNGESYSFSRENFKLFTNTKVVDKIIKKVDYKLNDNQERVLKMYNNMNVEYRETEMIDYKVL